MRDISEATWEKIKWTCLILFIIGTFVFILFITNWDIHSSQHVWCQVIDKLNSAPAPNSSAGPPAQHAYGLELARDFKILKEQLGC